MKEMNLDSPDKRMTDGGPEKDIGVAQPRQQQTGGPPQLDRYRLGRSSYYRRS